MTQELPTEAERCFFDENARKLRLRAKAISGRQRAIRFRSRTSTWCERLDKSIGERPCLLGSSDGNGPWLLMRS